MGVAFKSLALASVLSRYILQFFCAQQGERRDKDRQSKRKKKKQFRRAVRRFARRRTCPEAVGLAAP